MASSDRRAQRSLNIWPGFVDALATLLMVIIFVLLVFVLAQFFMSQALSGRDAALLAARGELAALADALALERKGKEDLAAALARIEDELRASVEARVRLDEEAAALRLRTEGAEAEIAVRIDEATRLAQDVAALRALKTELEAEAAALGKRAEAAEGGLIEERKLSESARAEVALLNRQLAAVREQLAALTTALDASEKKSADQQVLIASLGQRLNAALAGRVQELARYRSEFFGRMREILGEQAEVQIVGDRFVFASEVLFPVGSAELNEQGRAQLIRIADALKAIAARIPSEIDWILQVEGHTDRTPIRTAQFPSNWELSTSRAMTVIRLLTDQGLPPQRLAAAGYGEFHPLDPGTDEQALQHNRRIELKLTQR